MIKLTKKMGPVKAIAEVKDATVLRFHDAETDELLYRFDIPEGRKLVGFRSSNDLIELTGMAMREGNNVTLDQVVFTYKGKNRSYLRLPLE